MAFEIINLLTYLLTGGRLDDIRRRWSWQRERSRLRRRSSALDLTEWPTSIRCVPTPWTRSPITHFCWTKSIETGPHVGPGHPSSPLVHLLVIYYDLWCVWWDVKPYSINQSIIETGAVCYCMSSSGQNVERHRISRLDILLTYVT